jgi:hypothetical protein
MPTWVNSYKTIMSAWDHSYRAVFAYFSKSQMCNRYILQLNIEFAGTLQ